MNFVQKILPNTLKLFPQAQNGDRPAAAIKGLRRLGYSMPQIRAALLKLHGVRIFQVSREHEVPRTTLYSAMSGQRATPRAREILSGVVGVPEDLMFPPEERQSRRGAAR